MIPPPRRVAATKTTKEETKEVVVGKQSFLVSETFDEYTFSFLFFFISLTSKKKKYLVIELCLLLFHSHTFLRLLRLLHVECSSLLSFFFLFLPILAAVIILTGIKRGVVRVRPERGRMVGFSSLSENGHCNYKSEHYSSAVQDLMGKRDERDERDESGGGGGGGVRKSVVQKWYSRVAHRSKR